MCNGKSDKVFAGEMGQEALKLRPVFDRFYAEEFDRVKDSVGENPLAAGAVRGLREKGYSVILATNPLFPAVAVKTRLSWIGLAPEDFLEITSYEEYSFCKPNPAYFGQILERTGKRPEKCLMVGKRCCGGPGFSGAGAGGLSGNRLPDQSGKPGAFRDQARKLCRFCELAELC